MYYKSFSFAGLSLIFESTVKIEDSAGYSPFKKEISDGLKIRIINGNLPEFDGTIVFKRRNHRCLISENKIIYFSSYYCSTEERYKDYACFIQNSKDEATLYVDFEDGLWDSMVFDALDIPRLLIGCGYILLHSSCVLYEDTAILFTAPKHTGKSTQAVLWEKYANAKILNGDRVAIKVDDGVVYACGTPYRGSSKISENFCVPVKSIVYLSQGQDNNLIRINGREAFIKLFEGVSCDVELNAQLSEASNIVCDIIDYTDIYYYECKPDVEAVKFLQRNI